MTWKIGGEAGFGIMSSGIMLARSFSRAGYHIFSTNDYPSLIRGGHNVVTVRIGSTPFTSMNKDLHILIALNKETVELHKQEFSDGMLLVFDPNDHEWQTAEFPRAVKLLPVPLREIATKLGGEAIMRNTVALGVTVALLGAPFELLEQVIRDQFKKKGEEVVAHNLTIARSGYDYVKTTFPEEESMFLEKGRGEGKSLILNGSEAVGLGAARAGLKLAAIYPMTPINSLITFLADHAKDLQLVYKQPEDEIAGINMAIGASVAGVRSMVATSGGGFALMVEGLSLTGMIEVPLVIDMGMRVGPATGMPTYTEQGELQFLIHAGHGEFPRIVLAPGDGQEAYELTVDAFNLADRYQVPVFVLTDKLLNESQWCVPDSVFKKDVVIDRGKLVKQEELPSDGSYKRYALSTDDGVSPRSVPGMKNGFFYANSYEHDEVGHLTEIASVRTAMVTKRLKKLAAMAKDMRAPTVYGDSTAQITFVAWGSTKGAVIEAMNLLAKKGIKARLIHFTWLYPFPSQAVTALLSSAPRIIDVEQNATGQLASLVREYTGISITEEILKFDGRPLYPEEIVEKVA